MANLQATKCVRVASGPSYPLFRAITRQKRPDVRDFEVALFVCETLSSKVSGSDASSIWDLLASLRLPSSQESWLRALFIDLAGPSPVSLGRDREADFRSYLARVRRKLRDALLTAKRVRAASPQSSLESLERLLQ